MKRWLLITFQVLSIGVLVLIIAWGGPEAWRQISSGDRTYILFSFMLLGLASIVSTIRFQLIARSTTGQSLAPWTRFYYLTMTIRALGDSAFHKVDKLMDVSYGGVRIISPQKISPNTDLSITILLEDYKLKFIAQVKRCEDHGSEYDLGLQFITISKKNLKRLYQMIK